MSDHKHTAGPWTYGPALSWSENHHGYRVGSPSAGYVVAEVMPLDQDGVAGKPNAVLVAAAPTMREALEKALPILKQAHSMVEEREYAHSLVVHALALADGQEEA